MKRLFLTAAIAAAMLTAPAMAEQAKVKTDPEGAFVTGLTVNDCLVVLSGLTQMDQVERTKPFDFPRGGVRLDIAHNMAVLTAVQNDAQPAQQKIFNQVLKTVPAGADGKTAVVIQPGTDAALEYDRLLRELTAKPCRATITRLKVDDLNLDKNQLSLGVLSAIDRILDR